MFGNLLLKERRRLKTRRRTPVHGCPSQEGVFCSRDSGSKPEANRKRFGSISEAFRKQIGSVSEARPMRKSMFRSKKTTIPAYEALPVGKKIRGPAFDRQQSPVFLTET
jgi:hypothetical protein